MYQSNYILKLKCPGKKGTYKKAVATSVVWKMVSTIVKLLAPIDCAVHALCMINVLWQQACEYEFVIIIMYIALSLYLTPSLQLTT